MLNNFLKKKNLYINEFHTFFSYSFFKARKYLHSQYLKHTVIYEIS